MKNVSLLVGKRARNFGDVKKLLTNTTGSGTQLWIPEDEAGKYCDFETLEVSENGEFAPVGFDGFDKVVVDVQHGGTGFIDKMIDRNGIYKPADDGVPGYSSVNVNIQSKKVTGEYAIQLEQNSNLGNSLAYPCGLAVVGDDVYAAYGQRLYKQTNGTGSFVDVRGVADTCRIVCYQGELYQFSWYGSGSRTTYLSKWNGAGFTRIDESAFPNTDSPLYNFYSNAVVIYHDDIYVLGGFNNYSFLPDIYKWDGTAWEKVGEIPSEQGASQNRLPTNPVVYKDKIYYFYTDSGNEHNFYSWNGSVFEEQPKAPNNTIGLNIPAVFKIQDKERIHICDFTQQMGYSFNGEFWRPETGASLYNGANGYISTWEYKGQLYATRYKLNVVT